MHLRAASSTIKPTSVSEPIPMNCEEYVCHIEGISNVEINADGEEHIQNHAYACQGEEVRQQLASPKLMAEVVEQRQSAD